MFDHWNLSCYRKVIERDRNSWDSSDICWYHFGSLLQFWAQIFLFSSAPCRFHLHNSSHHMQGEKIVIFAGQSIFYCRILIVCSNYFLTSITFWLPSSVLSTDFLIFFCPMSISPSQFLPSYAMGKGRYFRWSINLLLSDTHRLF